MKTQIFTNVKLMSLMLITTFITTIQNSDAQSWNLTGNTGTNSSANFIGTTDNVAFKIRTNNVVRITVNTSGKVGVGIALPVFKLDVHGGSISTDSMYRISGVQVLNRNASNQVQLGDATANVGIGTSSPSSTLDVNGVIKATGGNSGNWNTAYLWGNHATVGYLTTESDPQVGSNSNNVVPKWNGTALVTGSIFDNGDIGIGTQLPQAKMQITFNSSDIDPQLLLYENANDYSRLNFGNTGTTNYWSVAGYNTVANTTARLNFYNSVYGNVLSLTGDGNVFIGATAPAAGYKLSVGGKVICTEMKIQLQANWPDYVFDSSYKLISLEEVGKFTSIYGHLPGIPSAAEVKTAGGFEVGDMQTKLLEKVEELTLYLVRQNQEIELLKNDLNEVTKARK